MTKIILFLVALFVVSSCSNTTSEAKSGKNQWNDEKRERHLNNRNDSTAWDIKLLEGDKQNMDDGDYGPFELGVFPEPRYDIIGKGSFEGIGNKSGKFQIKDKSILMNSFFLLKNTLNKRRLKDMKNEIFFQILVLTDTIDKEKYELTNAVALSRNHPDYLGQGFIKTKTNKIEYLAFTTAENNAYAIINTRIFDLRFGKTILIAPQKDKTLRSLQIESPQISSDSIIQYTESLIKDQKVMKFFQNKNNI